LQAKVEHYRECAANSRRLAKDIADADAKEHLLESRGSMTN
jgi:hypothetical protein